MVARLHPGLGALCALDRAPDERHDRSGLELPVHTSAFHGARLGDDVVATIQWVDGTTIDAVRKVESADGAPAR